MARAIYAHCIKSQNEAREKTGQRAAWCRSGHRDRQRTAKADVEITNVNFALTSACSD